MVGKASENWGGLQGPTSARTRDASGGPVPCAYSLQETPLGPQWSLGSELWEIKVPGGWSWSIAGVVLPWESGLRCCNWEEVCMGSSGRPEAWETRQRVS